MEFINTHKNNTARYNSEYWSMAFGPLACESINQKYLISPLFRTCHSFASYFDFYEYDHQNDYQNVHSTIIQIKL